MLYARDPAELERLLEEHSRLLVESGVEVQRKLDTSNLDGFEPFGFRDGISQPFVEGLAKVGAGRPDRSCGRVRPRLRERARALHGRAAARGRDRPERLVPRLPPARAGRARVLAVHRLGCADPAERTRLAAKMVGRWPGGAPLALSPDRDDPALAEANDFGYFHEDPVGTGCPVGAHVRRTNPRDSLDPRPGTEKSLAINRRHRLLRRGREYGQAAEPRGGADRVAGAGRGARPALHLPEREHRPPVRVRPEHLAEQPEVRRSLRRLGPAHRPVGPVRRNVHDALGHGRAVTSQRHAALHHGQGRRVLLPAGPRQRCGASPRSRTSRRPSARSARRAFIFWRS